MALTNCQEKAAKQFLSFLITPEKHMVLSGSPGTGKTFMLNHMIEMLPNSHRIATIMGAEPITNIAVTATTNKAAEVLQERFQSIDVRTIHSTLGLTVKDNYQTGETTTIKGKNFTPLKDTLVLMDEASMADSSLLALLEEGTKHNCKIVFIGDHCQLAPVNEEKSPVFNSGYITSNLTTQMRTSDSPVLTLLNAQMRETVETGVFRKIPHVPGVIDFVNAAEMRTLLTENFIKEEKPNHKILAFTNNSVQQYNQFIRSEKGLPEQFLVGDTVVSNNVVEAGGARTIIEKLYKVRAVGQEIHEDMVKYYNVDVGLGRYLKQPLDYTEVTKLLKQFAAKKDWMNYFRLKNEFSDFRFAYASTVHKSQGSTYDTVYIDLEDISVCRDLSQLARMLYVAISRATTRVVFYGTPPKYLR